MLIDFNEMVFDAFLVMQDIDREQWLRRWSSTQLYLRFSRNIHAYYKKRMKEELTKENLELLWSSYLK